MRKILSIFFAVFLVASGILHIVYPEPYAPMIPEFIPEILANGLSAILELVIGALLLMPKYRHWGGLGFMMLMIGFLPIHIWDFLKDEPAIGSKTVAAIRIVIQFLMIYAGLWIWKKKPSVNP